MATTERPGDVGLLRGDWQERLAYIVDAMGEMSLQTEAQEMVRSYGARVRSLLPAARWFSLSRRGLERPGTGLLDPAPGPRRSIHGSRKTGCRF